VDRTDYYVIITNYYSYISEEDQTKPEYKYLLDNYIWHSTEEDMYVSWINCKNKDSGDFKNCYELAINHSLEILPSGH
jgi:hypothetical protein